MWKKLIIGILFSYLGQYADAQVSRTISQSVRFESGKSEMLPEEAALLKAFTDLSAQIPNVQIQIAGKIEKVGSSATNILLAKHRILSVRKFLIENGIADSLILINEIEEIVEAMESKPNNRSPWVTVFSIYKDTPQLPPPSLPVLASTLVEVAAPDTLKLDTILAKIKPPLTLTESNFTELLPLWDVEPQTFYIKVGRDTLLETIRGLYIYLPAYSIYTDGKTPLCEEVAFVVKEYRRKSDLAAAYLGGNIEGHPFVPYGIYYFEARCDEKKLLMKADNPIRILQPCLLMPQDIQLYQGSLNDSLQKSWTKVSEGSAPFRCNLPENWKKESHFFLYHWLTPEYKVYESLKTHLRTQIKVTREQADMLTSTLLAQAEWEKDNSYKPLSSAFTEAGCNVFCINNLNSYYGFLRPTEWGDTTTLTLSCEMKSMYGFQLIRKKDKLILPPVYQSKDKITFQLSNSDEYWLMSVKYYPPKVAVSILDVWKNATDGKINTPEFTEYETPLQAHKALKVLD